MSFCSFHLKLLPLSFFSSGFCNLDFFDRQEMCNISCFQAAITIFATEWFNPELKKFKYFWNWTLSPENPMYLFKLHLLQAGDAVNKLRLSPVETALTLAIIGASAGKLSICKGLILGTQLHSHDLYCVPHFL